MNFFQEELGILTGKNTAFKSSNPVFVGRACFIPLTDGRKARMEFVTLGTAGNYEALQISILNPYEGQIDRLQLRFEDYFSKINTNYGMRPPTIWADQGQALWYGAPDKAEKLALSNAAHAFISLFKKNPA